MCLNFAPDCCICFPAADKWWLFVIFASFIENFGTHVITSITIGGRDVIYVKQHQSSSLSGKEIMNYVKDIGDQRFLNSESQPTTIPLKYKDKVGYKGKYFISIPCFLASEAMEIKFEVS